MASNEVLQERLRLLQLKASNKRKQQVSKLSVRPCGADIGLDSKMESNGSLNLQKKRL
jgi:hypothetical protein